MMTAAATKPATESFLFLGDWEAARAQAHTVRRQRAERVLCSLQLRVQSGASSLDAWLAALESRRKLEEVAAGAASRALSELEARWRPQRLDASDGAAAAWLLAAEQNQAAALGARATQWAAAIPEGGGELRRRHLQLWDSISPTGAPAAAAAAAGISPSQTGGSVACALRAWDSAHAAAEQAWQTHNQGLEASSQAAVKDQAPPDVWLSEVVYREVARTHAREQEAAEKKLTETAATLAGLEVERSAFWNTLAASYVRTCQALGHSSSSSSSTASPAAFSPPPRGAAADSQSAPEPGKAATTPGIRAQGQPTQPSLPAPAVRPAIAGEEWLVVHVELPAMPSASGAILQRVPVAMPVEKGLFGIGGGGWRDGCTLVLTLHGYLHIFDRPEVASSAEDQSSASGQGSAADGPTKQSNSSQEEEELAVLAIKASVYVPMATRCVFLRKGKEYTLDVAEAESQASAPEASGGLGSGLRRWLGRESSSKAVPRRAQARVCDEALFTALEGRCHEFVRRGQGLRAAAANAASTAAP
mmetsp:Transcript_8631/g.14117  ORF Transcript_8631/g.14117 Transcript_8631/m.14117 type:complete len:532 (-) Transcript_8631:85-1680(-)